MNKILLIVSLASFLNAQAMFKSIAVKTAAASMAAGTALSYPKIKLELEKWKMKQQLKKELEEQNKVVISNR